MRILANQRRLWLVAGLLAALFMATGASPTLAQPAPPSAVVDPAVPTPQEADVRFLYPAGQTYKYDTIFPLTVELNNRGKAPKTYHGTWPLTLPMPKDLKTVVLEPGEKRRFSLVLPRQEASRLYNIEYNKVAYTPDLVPNPRNSIVGVLAPASEKFDYIRTLKLEVDPNVGADAGIVDPANPEASKPKLVPLASVNILDPELVPESWPILSSLDVIIVYDMQSMSLSKAQKHALLSWACQGGRLVLVSDGLPEEFRGTPFEDHLPLRPTGVVAEKGLVQLVGDPVPGAQTLMSYQGHPLLLSRPLMRGSVSLIAAPLKDLGPLSVAEAENLWRQVMPTPPDNGTQQPNYNSYVGPSSPINSNMLKDIPELPRAQAGWVALYLLLYALIVGPVNLGILRKKDKMLWSFVTVPAIAVVFAGGAYLMNVARRSSLPVLREIGLLEVKSGSKLGYAESEALFFSPSAGPYSIDCAPDGICFPSVYTYDQDQFGLYSSLTDGGLQAHLDMGTWDVSTLGTESLIELPSPIKASWKKGILTVDSSFVTGTDEAMLYSEEEGGTAAFTLKGGKQTEKLKFNAGTATTLKFDAISVSSPEHPGRNELATSLAQQNTPSLRPGKIYLLFWTDKVAAPLTLQKPSLHRAEYLMVVEVDS